VVTAMHRKPKTLRDYRGIFECKSPLVIRRRSRVNPVFLIAAFTAALLFDALSSATAKGVWHRIWEILMANPAVAVAATLASASFAYLIARIATARFARHRSIYRAARANDLI
jgi:hypothetical protein